MVHNIYSIHIAWLLLSCLKHLRINILQKLSALVQRRWKKKKEKQGNTKVTWRATLDIILVNVGYVL